MSGKDNLGDWSVDGLLAGLVAGLFMIIYLVLAGVAFGEPYADILGRFSPAGNGDPLVGVIAHLAVSAIYGAGFGILLRILGLRKRAPLAGLVYGLGLFLLAQYVIIPETQSTLMAFMPYNLAMAHILYGLVLGWRIRNRGSAGAGA